MNPAIIMLSLSLLAPSGHFNERPVKPVAITAAVSVRPIVALSPVELSQVKFDQRPGQRISANLVFRDETGRSVKLGELFGKRPVLLVPGYYRCPMLCTLINDGLINALTNLRATAGIDFDVIDFSIDPTETPAAASARKAIYVRRYGRAGGGAGWHCLVSDGKAIAQLCNEIGFRYTYDPKTHEYAHPSGIVVLTPNGKISRYVFGVTFNSSELRDAIATAKSGKSETVFSQIVLLCYHYNPITGKYGALILSVLRIGSLGFGAAFAWWVFSMARRPNHKLERPG